MHKKDELGDLIEAGAQEWLNFRRGPTSTAIGRMNRFLCWILCFLVAPVAVARGEAQPLLGYDEEAATHQRQLEAAYDELLAADDLRQWMRRLSAKPHHVGSAYGKENAEYPGERFTSWGYDTRIAQ